MTALLFVVLKKKLKQLGAFYFPGSAAEKPAQGEIIAVGNGQITDNGVRALDVKVGDKVLFGTYAGTTVKVNGEELLIMKESDILAVLESLICAKKVLFIPNQIL